MANPRENSGNAEDEEAIKFASADPVARMSRPLKVVYKGSG